MPPKKEHLIKINKKVEKLKDANKNLHLHLEEVLTKAKRESQRT